jgi:hypothetical protein
MYDLKSFVAFEIVRASGLGFRDRRRTSRVEVLLVSDPELVETALREEGWRRHAR